MIEFDICQDRSITGQGCIRFQGTPPRLLPGGFISRFAYRRPSASIIAPERRTLDQKLLELEQRHFLPVTHVIHHCSDAVETRGWHGRCLLSR